MAPIKDVAATTRELINHLQRLDPSGDLPITVLGKQSAEMYKGEFVEVVFIPANKEFWLLSTNSPYRFDSDDDFGGE
jgi:hypothetical protein